MSQIKVSIAIVTRNRADSLEATLLSLHAQNYPLYEIIISDDSSDTDEISKTKTLADRFNCIYITGPQAGLYANRNHVAKACTGTHIRTMDDDHQFPEGHLLLCNRAIEAEPNTIWTIGEYSVLDNAERKMPFPVPGQLTASGNADYLGDEEYFGISCGGTIYPRKVIDDSVLNFSKYKFGNVYLEYGARLNYLGYKLKVLKSTYLIHCDLRTTATSMNARVVNEAAVFAMLCFSFFYKPTLKNKLTTLVHITKAFLTGEIGLKQIISAYKNYTFQKKALLKNVSYSNSIVS